MPVHNSAARRRQRHDPARHRADVRRRRHPGRRGRRRRAGDRSSIQADRPDIVLADVGMPERDGYEVAAFIKRTPQLAHIPVLLLTGAFEPVDEARARAVGCDGVLVKPFEPQMVISRVKELLAGPAAAPALWPRTAGASPPTQPASAGARSRRSTPRRRRRAGRIARGLFRSARRGVCQHGGGLRRPPASAAPQAAAVAAHAGS